MTTAQLLNRIFNGGKITLRELHRLECRVASMRQQAEAIEAATRQCYIVKDRCRVPNPQLVEVS